MPSVPQQVLCMSRLCKIYQYFFGNDAHIMFIFDTNIDESEWKSSVNIGELKMTKSELLTTAILLKI